MIKGIHTTGDHLVFFLELVHPVFATHFHKARIVRAFHLDDFLMAFFFIEGVEGVFGNGIHTLKQFTHANRERKGGGLDVQNTFNLAAIQVHLVDEGDDGRMSHAAHIHKLDGLLFYAVHAVDKHQGSIHGGQGSVSIFAKVLVPRGIHQVEHATFKREIQHGTGNRNTALLLNLHPVTDGITAVRLGTHVARLADDVSVPEELFGDGGLTRVGVADNSKSAALFDFCVHNEFRFYARKYRKKTMRKRSPVSRSNQTQVDCKGESERKPEKSVINLAQAVTREPEQSNAS